MNKLIILTGDSGCGKTHLMRLIMKQHQGEFIGIKKYSDREKRPGEENAIEIQPGCPTEQVQQMDYTYIGKENKVYGFNKEPIEKAFKNGKSPMVIVDDEELLIELCKDYKGKICPIYVQRDATDLDFIQELKESGERTEEQIIRRLDTRHEKQKMWKRQEKLFGYRYIINGKFLGEEELLNWFETIATENEIDIDVNKKENKAKGIIHYFRNLWKGRPAVASSKLGEEPIISETTEERQEGNIK